MIIQNCDGAYEIEYFDFCNLLEKGDWKVYERMKYNWDGERHKQYIDSLVHSPNHVIDFFVDNKSLSMIKKINVEITPVTSDTEFPSKKKHISFTKQTMK